MPKSWYEDPKIPLEKNRYCFARVMWSSCNGHETHILKLAILPVLLDVDFTCNLFHCGLVSVCRFTVFLALLGNHCYSFHRTKWRLVTSICRGPGPVTKKMPFFSPKFKSAAKFSAPAQEGNLFFLSGRSARKKIHNFPIKSSHLCRTSRQVWLSCSACDHCRAYQGFQFQMQISC